MTTIIDGRGTLQAPKIWRQFQKQKGVEGQQEKEQGIVRGRNIGRYFCDISLRCPLNRCVDDSINHFHPENRQRHNKFSHLLLFQQSKSRLPRQKLSMALQMTSLRCWSTTHSDDDRFSYSRIAATKMTLQFHNIHYLQKCVNGKTATLSRRLQPWESFLEVINLKQRWIFCHSLLSLSCRTMDGRLSACTSNPISPKCHFKEWMLILHFPLSNLMI